MNPFLWGLSSALGWGTADFVARISGRALGPANSLLATASVGTVGMGLWLVVRDTPMEWDPSGLHWLILIGFSLSTAMLLLYTSLARGPVSIAAPLISSTPAFVVPGALLLGVVPSSGQLFAMAGVMVGTLIVARTAHPNSGMREGERGVGMTVATGLGAAFLFAVALLLAREAVPIYGVWQVAWSGRCISLVFVILFMILTRTRVNVLPGGGRHWLPRESSMPAGLSFSTSDRSAMAPRWHRSAARRWPLSPCCSRGFSSKSVSHRFNGAASCWSLPRVRFWQRNAR